MIEFASLCLTLLVLLDASPVTKEARLPQDMSLTPSPLPAATHPRPDFLASRRRATGLWYALLTRPKGDGGLDGVGDKQTGGGACGARLQSIVVPLHSSWRSPSRTRGHFYPATFEERPEIFGNVPDSLRKTPCQASSGLSAHTSLTSPPSAGDSDTRPYVSPKHPLSLLVSPLGPAAPHALQAP